MFKQKLTQFIAAAIVISFPFSAFAQAVDPNFNPAKIIDDNVFSDTQTFGGAAGIQKFLETKGSPLANTGPDFLAKLKEPQAALLKQGLEDPEPNLPRLRTAAELIWDASMQSGLNPQVILVTLNKEQSLISSSTNFTDAQLQTALDHSMGFACPDSGGCGDLFPGFYYQLFGNYDSSGNRYLGAAKSLMKSETTGRGPGTAKAGDTITLDNTLGGYDGILPEQTIMIMNNATAALYRYTPHVFNGNYNFWRFFNAWFKYPNGTLFTVSDGSTNTYIIQNGLKALVPLFVAQSRGLNLSSSIVLSPTESNSYTTDTPLGPPDNTIAEAQGDTNKYVFESNVRHQASDLVIKQRGLDPAKVLSVTAADLQLFNNGTVLPPKDGTIIRGTTNQSVYLVENGKIKMYSAYTFAQNNIKPKNVYTVPDSEISTYTQDGFVAPKDGSLVKSAGDNTVYLVQSGLKQPVLGDVFKNQGYSFKKVAAISDDELNALPLGFYATPKDRTFFAVDSKAGPLFMFKQGTMHSISAFVAKQRGITPDYVFSQAVTAQWVNGIPVPPSDNTIVKGDSDGTVYLVVAGQLRPLTYKAFTNRKITPKRIVILPQMEVDAYAKGDMIEK